MLNSCSQDPSASRVTSSQILSQFLWWTLLKQAIPARWKNLIFEYSDANGNGIYQNHHVIKGARIISLGKLFSKGNIFKSNPKHCK